MQIAEIFKAKPYTLKDPSRKETRPKEHKLLVSQKKEKNLRFP